MSELYHDAQLPLDSSSQSAPIAKRSYRKGQSKDNPPTEVRYCKKCGQQMTLQWDSTSPGKWRYRCNPCRSQKRSKQDSHKYYLRLIERNPHYGKEKRARALQRNPNLYQEKYQRERIRSAKYPSARRVSMQGYRLKNRLARFGLTKEQYSAMHEQQGGVCAICGKSETNRRLAIDHDHTTGQVRALLCSKCNTALGLTEDDVERLRAMADYIESHRSKA